MVVVSADTVLALTMVVDTRCLTVLALSLLLLPLPVPHLSSDLVLAKAAATLPVRPNPFLKPTQVADATLTEDSLTDLSPSNNSAPHLSFAPVPLPLLNPSSILVMVLVLDRTELMAAALVDMVADTAILTRPFNNSHPNKTNNLNNNPNNNNKSN